MNCKPGDLAVIVGRCPANPALHRRIVEVLKGAPAGRRFLLPNGGLHDPVDAGRWVCRFVGGPVVVPCMPAGSMLSAYAPIPDSALRPIRPRAADVAIDDVQDVPAEIAA